MRALVEETRKINANFEAQLSVETAARRKTEQTARESVVRLRELEDAHAKLEDEQAELQRQQDALKLEMSAVEATIREHKRVAETAATDCASATKSARSSRARSETIGR